MRRAIVLAREAEAAGGEPYGALIANSRSTIVAEGRNHASRDPLWHGETSAIANLSRLINTSVYDIAGNLTLYTTAEPCPMCMGAILWSGFSTVVYGTSIPYIAAQGRDQIAVRADAVAPLQTQPASTRRSLGARPGGRVVKNNLVVKNNILGHWGGSAKV